MRIQHGFTLIELVVSIAIVIILAGIGTPMLTQFLQNSRVSTVSSDLYAMVNVARAEAIRRNTRVTLCALGSNNQCASGGGVWNFEAYGWAVFEDGGAGAGSSMLGATAPAAQLVRVQTVPSGVLVRGTFGQAMFSPMGHVSMAGNGLGGSLKVCKGTPSGSACDSTLNVRCIMISGAGSPSVMVPTGAAAASAQAGSTGGCN